MFSSNCFHSCELQFQLLKILQITASNDHQLIPENCVKNNEHNKINVQINQKHPCNRMCGAYERIWNGRIENSDEKEIAEKHKCFYAEQMIMFHCVNQR